MALDTRVMDFPDWMQPRSPWTQTDTLNALRVGINNNQQNQQMALRLKELELQQQSQTILNDARLQQIEEAEAEVADLPLLQQYARDPDSGIPSFRSPKSYQKLAAIDLSMKRSQAGEMWANTQKAFWERFAKLDGYDQAVLNDMLCESRGEITGDIFKYAGEAFERQQKREQEQKVFAPTEMSKEIKDAKDATERGDLKAAKLHWERAETLARGGRESSIQSVNIPLTKFKTRVQQLHNMFRNAEIKAADYQTALDDATRELEAAQNAPFATPQTTATPQNDPLGILK